MCRCLLRLFLVAAVASAARAEDTTVAWDFGPAVHGAAVEQFLPSPMTMPEGLPFAAELGALRAQVLLYLNGSERVRYPNRQVPPAALSRTLSLAVFIRDPAYVAPLRQLLNDREERYGIARSLLAFSYPAVDERVQAYRNHVETTRAGCVIERRSVAELIDAPPVPAPSLGDRLVALEGDEPAQAAEALVGLIDAGIVPTLDAVRSIWPQLDREQRHQILERAMTPRTIYTGKHRLRAFLASRRSEPNGALDRDMLAAAAYRLGDRGALPEVAAFIRRCGREVVSDGASPECVLLMRLAAEPSPELLDAYLEIASAANASVRELAWRAIAMTPSTIAHQALLSCVWNLEEKACVKAALFHGLRDLGYRAPLDRWTYLAIILDSFEAVEIGEFATSAQINAFEALAGEEFGADGRMIPGGFNAAQAAVTVGRCQAWAVAEPERIDALRHAMAFLGVDGWRPRPPATPPPAIEVQVDAMSKHEMRVRLGELAKLRRQLRRLDGAEARAQFEQAEQEWDAILRRMRERP
jgi:hypothetical protein